MMVPRSFAAYQRRPSDSSSSYDEKPRCRPSKSKLAPAAAMKKPPSRLPSPPSPPPPTIRPTSTTPVEPQPRPSIQPVHSQPVVIPQNTMGTQSLRSRGHHGHHSRHAKLPNDHKTDLVPPAVAALLAVTSIPPRTPTTRRKRSATQSRRVSIDELMQEWRQDDLESSPSRYASPLDILLESPDYCENEDASSIEPGSEKEPDLLSVRSISSDSMPSLEFDDQSSVSWSSPITPSFSRREKTISSPPKEDCVQDHPLLSFSADNTSSIDMADQDVQVILIQDTRSATTKARSSFKSNLTASFQALKSAARSFSNFTAPSIPPDDLLTRSLLAPRFTSEMRPKEFQGVPTPAMRRYLNPPQTPAPTISPTELFYDTLTPQPTSSASSPMIQLQTYSRSNSPSRKKQANSEAGRALSPVPTMRQREPRENSDFLRVIVLEMNMRREGKLDTKAAGKARIWLPPRKTEAVDVQMTGKMVPSRWVGVCIDD